MEFVCSEGETELLVFDSMKGSGKCIDIKDTRRPV